MVKYNTKELTATEKITTENLAGGQAFKLSPENELAQLLMTSFFSGNDNYYETDAARQKRFIEILDACPPEFAAKAAIYSRDKYGMRTSSHMAAVSLAAKEFPNKEGFFRNVIVRPDDMLEITSGILSAANGGKGKIPNAVKRAFASNLSKLSAYHLAKYKNSGKKVNMFDLINLTHPKSTPAINDFMNGKGIVPETYETKLSAAGNVAENLSEEDKALAKSENKAQAWTDLIQAGKLGYMALVKNLRNIFEQATEGTKRLALEQLVDEERIKGSRILPFRFLTAYNEVGAMDSRLSTAISKAFDIACKANVTNVTGDTLIVVDTSGSMASLNSRASVPNEYLGYALAGALGKAIDPLEKVDLMIFGTTAKYIPLDRGASGLTNALNMATKYSGAVGHGTNFEAIFQAINKPYKRIVILSDMQGWVGYSAPAAPFRAYCERHKCSPVVYSWDLAGYGTTQLPTGNANKVVPISGWMGDKVFELIDMIENNKAASLVEEINKIDLTRK